MHPDTFQDAIDGLLILPLDTGRPRCLATETVESLL